MGGEPLFFCFFDAAVNVAIDTIWQKYTFWQKSGVSGIVCREKVKGNRILLVFAEKGISLAEKAVVIGEKVKVGYDLAKVKLFGKSGSFAKWCMAKTVKKKWENDK